LRGQSSAQIYGGFDHRCFGFPDAVLGFDLGVGGFLQPGQTVKITQQALSNLDGILSFYTVISRSMMPYFELLPSFTI